MWKRSAIRMYRDEILVVKTVEENVEEDEEIAMIAGTLATTSNKSKSTTFIKP